MTLGGKLANMRTEASSMGWNTTIQGFTASNPDMAKFMPAIIQFKGSASGIPLGTMLKSGDSKSQLASVTKNNSAIHLDRLVIDAPAYGLDATGEVNSVQSAITGNMKMSLRGVNDLLTWINTPSNEQKSVAAFIPPAFLGVLSMIQMTGKPATDEQGRAVLTYDLQYGADGKLMLNGNDLSGITGGAAAAPAAVKPAAPHSGMSAPAAPQP
jgi:hypothetical protein